jgi:hypothetical protein
MVETVDWAWELRGFGREAVLHTIPYHPYHTIPYCYSQGAGVEKQQVFFLLDGCLDG